MAAQGVNLDLFEELKRRVAARPRAERYYAIEQVLVERGLIAAGDAQPAPEWTADVWKSLFEALPNGESQFLQSVVTVLIAKSLASFGSFCYRAGIAAARQGITG